MHVGEGIVEMVCMSAFINAEISINGRGGENLI